MYVHVQLHHEFMHILHLIIMYFMQLHCTVHVHTHTYTVHELQCTRQEFIGMQAVNLKFCDHVFVHCITCTMQCTCIHVHVSCTCSARNLTLKLNPGRIAGDARGRAQNCTCTNQWLFTLFSKIRLILKNFYFF